MTYIAFLEVVVCLMLVSLSLPRSFFPLILFLLLWLVYFIRLFSPPISLPVAFYFSIGGAFQAGFCHPFSLLILTQTVSLFLFVLCLSGCLSH